MTSNVYIWNKQGGLDIGQWVFFLSVFFAGLLTEMKSRSINMLEENELGR